MFYNVVWPDGLLSPHDYKSVSQAINPYEQTLMTFTAAIYLITSIGTYSLRF